jgi:hypothetical protein
MDLTTAGLEVDRIRWTDIAGTVQESPAHPSLLEAGIITGRPVRKPNRYRGQKNYPGKHWFASSGLHIPFESMLERSALIRLDFATDVVAIAAQPMRIYFGSGGFVVPDFLAEHPDGSQTVFEVKSSSGLTTETLAKFAKSERVCRSVGWGCQVLTECDVIVMDNLELLAGFRNPAYAPTAEARRRILTAARAPLSLQEGAAASGLPTRTGYASVYHLAWKRALALDLTTPITNLTTIAA